MVASRVRRTHEGKDVRVHRPLHVMGWACHLQSLCRPGEGYIHFPQSKSCTGVVRDALQSSGGVVIKGDGPSKSSLFGGGVVKRLVRPPLHSITCQGAATLGKFLELNPENRQMVGSPRALIGSLCNVLGEDRYLLIHSPLGRHGVCLSEGVVGYVMSDALEEESESSDASPLQSLLVFSNLDSTSSRVKCGHLCVTLN